jgi:Domain of unknown function (DUF1841)
VNCGLPGAFCCKDAPQRAWGFVQSAMPFFHTQSRDQLRQVYLDAWRKRRAGLPMEPLEMQVADVIELHPEYQAALEQPDSVRDRDYTPEGGQSNPFLHMGLHLAVRDQIATDRPPGIRAAYESLARRLGSAHEAEHRLIDCLAEAIWTAQRAGRAPDEMAYLERVQQLAR